MFLLSICLRVEGLKQNVVFRLQPLLEGYSNMVFVCALRQLLSSNFVIVSNTN